ncbi:MAG: NAD(P)H-dependent flavin oxidoreductase, partial [Methylocystaceae bacterium]
IAAGGIVDGYDMAEMVQLGADGIQMATRFLLSEECSVADAYKQMYLQANKDDVILVKSPVGLPGRAIRNPFTELISRQGEIDIEECTGCLKDCSHIYCIRRALLAARDGDVDHGLVFTGQNVYKIMDILPVEEIIRKTIDQYLSV